jgi:G3E family GTPase
MVDMVTIDVVSGFLGAGKTTLCNKLLHYFVSHGERPVYIVNEFGKTGLDAELMRTGGFSSISIEGGCICCTLKENVASTILAVIKEHKPTRILFEPSGVFIFDKFLEIFQNSDFAERCQIGGLITVVDCLNYDKSKAAFGSFYYNQIKNAAVIVLSKMQKADTPIDEIICDVKNINPEAEIVSVPWDDFQEEDYRNILRNAQATDCRNASHAHERMQTASIDLSCRITSGLFEELLDCLSNGAFGDIYRAKGIACVDQRNVLVNIAGRDQKITEFKGVADYRITLIGKRIEMVALQAFKQRLRKE